MGNILDGNVSYLFLLSLFGLAMVLIMCGVLIGALYYYWRDQRMEDRMRSVVAEYVLENRCVECNSKPRAGAAQ